MWPIPNIKVRGISFERESIENVNMASKRTSTSAATAIICLLEENNSEDADE